MLCQNVHFKTLPNKPMVGALSFIPTKTDKSSYLQQQISILFLKNKDICLFVIYFLFNVILLLLLLVYD